MPLSLQSFSSRVAAALARPAFFAGALDSVLFVAGNESADLDSCASSILGAYLYSVALEQDKSPAPTAKLDLVVPLININRQDLALRSDVTYLLDRAGYSPHALAFLDDFAQPTNAATFLVDHNKLTGAAASLFPPDKVLGVLDHHADEAVYTTQATVPRTVRNTGSCVSLVTNFWRAQLGEPLVKAAMEQDGAAAAVLALSPILADTGNLAQRVCADDTSAASFLWSVINTSESGFDVYRTQLFDTLLEQKSDVSALSGADLLRKDYKEWARDDDSQLDYKIGISALPVSLETVWAQVDSPAAFRADVAAWAKKRDLDLAVVMTSYVSPDTGAFTRELMFVPAGKYTSQDVTTLVDKISGELQLRPTTEPGPYTFVQGNTAASRKKVAPLLRHHVQNAALNKI